MPVLTISAARAALPEVINRVVEGEEVTITRHGAPVAIVVRPDIVWARPGHEVLVDDEHLVAAVRERARRHGHTLQEELRMILEAAQSEPEPLPPLHLKTVRTSGTSTWTRAEIYGDDAR